MLLKNSIVEKTDLNQKITDLIQIRMFGGFVVHAKKHGVIKLLIEQDIIKVARYAIIFYPNKYFFDTN